MRREGGVAYFACRLNAEEREEKKAGLPRILRKPEASWSETPTPFCRSWKRSSVETFYRSRITGPKKRFTQGLLTPKDGPFPGIYVPLVSGPPTTTTTNTIKCLISWLCFELDQIRDHFSRPTWGVQRVKVASDLLYLKA